MSDLHHAGELLDKALAPFFPHLPHSYLHDLGREIYRHIEQLRRRDRLEPASDHEVYQTFLRAATRHLQQYGAGSVDDLWSWLYALACHAACHHLVEVCGPQHRLPAPLASLDELLAGDGELHLPAAPLVTTHDDELEQVLLQAIYRLKGRHRELAERHFLRGQSAEEVKHHMHISSDRAYRHLLRQTVKLLVDILKTALAHTLAATWVA